MNDIEAKIKELRHAGWSLAAISDEIGVNWRTVKRWEDEDSYPNAAKPILTALDSLGKRKPPKLKRYEGTHHTQRKNQL